MRVKRSEQENRQVQPCPGPNLRRGFSILFDGVRIETAVNSIIRHDKRLWYGGDQ